MTKDLGAISELKIALDSLYIWQTSINALVKYSKQKLKDLENS